MDWLDKILGKAKKAQPQEAAEKTKEASVALEKIAEFLTNERDKELSGALAGAPGKMAEIAADFEKLEADFTEMLSRPVQTQREEHRRIANHMKDNYLKRLPQILEKIRAPKAATYEAAAGFNAGVVESLQLLNKITADNRYLLFFYKNEFTALGKKLKETDSKAADFGKLVESLRPTAEKYASAGAEAKKLIEGGEGLKKLKARMGEIERDAMAAAQKIEEAASGKGAQKMEELEAKIIEAKKEEAALNSRASALLSPLERTFRKYEKNCTDKALLVILKAYREGPNEAVLAEKEGTPGLVTLCKAVQRELEQGKTGEDAKAREKYLEIMGKIIAGEMDRIGKELALAKKAIHEAQEQLRPMQEMQARLKSLNEERGKAEREAKKIQGEIKAAEDELETEIAALEKRINEVTRRELKIEAVEWLERQN